MNVRAYLDNNATTRLASEALAAMTPFLTDLYFNPSSAAGESFGLDRPLMEARRAVARLLGASNGEQDVVLTSGASEANSWAVHAATTGRAPGHIVSTAIEHPSLLAALDAARNLSWTVELAQPDPAGRVSAEAVAALLRPDTALVSVMLANNETGVLQPVAEIGLAIRAACPQAIFHVDATQALGRIEVSQDDQLALADLVSVSAHKFHGPKGVGALLTMDAANLPPLIHGAQERGRRGGTPDPAAAAGLAVAARMAKERLPQMVHVEALRDRFERALLDRLPKVRIVGASTARLPNTTCFVTPGLEASAAVEALALQGVILATGSACTSGSSAPSHVLTAMGIGYDEAKSALRVSLSHETSWTELEATVDAMAALATGELPRSTAWQERV